MLIDRRVLITGGAGFVGWHLATRLVGRNAVTVFDGFQDPVARTRPVPAGARLITGDVLDREAIGAAVTGHDIVIHLAAIVGVRAVGVDAVRTLNVAFDGTRNVLEAAAAGGVERVLVASTSEVYGERAVAPSEDDPTPVPPPPDSRWSYAAGKMAADHLAFAYDRQRLVRTVVLRPFNIYGPQQEKGAIVEMIARALGGQRIIVHGDGAQVRAYCYIDDLVDAFEAAAASPVALGEIFNVGNPFTAVTTRQLAELIRRLAGSSAPLLSEPARTADIRERTPRIDKAVRLLGFAPRVGLEEGITRTLEALGRRVILP